MASFAHPSPQPFECSCYSNSARAEHSESPDSALRECSCRSDNCAKQRTPLPRRAPPNVPFADGSFSRRHSTHSVRSSLQLSRPWISLIAERNDTSTTNARCGAGASRPPVKKRRLGHWACACRHFCCVRADTLRPAVECTDG